MNDVAVKIDLRPLLPIVVRDQGSRPTCLAFAVSDYAFCFTLFWHRLLGEALLL